MLYIAIGVFGFICFLIFDILSMYNKVIGKYVFVAIGIGLIVYSTIRIIDYSTPVASLSITRIIVLIFTILFTLLLIYSVFIEVGLNTYRKYAKPGLVTNGTYSLVRHPGVIWLFLAYFFAAIFFANSYLLFTAFIWTAVNTIYIVIQERWILIKLFDEYSTYIATTPMIIPNYSSLKKFITIQNWRKE